MKEKAKVFFFHNAVKFSLSLCIKNVIFWLMLCSLEWWAWEYSVLIYLRCFMRILLSNYCQSDLLLDQKKALCLWSFAKWFFIMCSNSWLFTDIFLAAAVCHKYMTATMYKCVTYVIEVQTMWCILFWNVHCVLNCQHFFFK